MMNSLDKKETLRTDLKTSNSFFGKSTPVILVCIHNIGYNTINHEFLYTMFSKYGKVLRILIFEKSKKMKAFIEFSDKISAAKACETLDNYLLFNDGTKMNTYPSTLTKIIFQNNNNGGKDYSQEKSLTKKFSGDYKEVQQDNHSRSKSAIFGSKFQQEYDFDVHGDCNHSTSTSTWTRANSGHESNDEDKEDEILRMIENHNRDMKNQEDDEKNSEEENERESFHRLMHDAFFSNRPKTDFKIQKNLIPSENTLIFDYSRQANLKVDDPQKYQLQPEIYTNTKCFDHLTEDNLKILNSKTFEKYADENSRLKTFYDNEFERVLKPSSNEKIDSKYLSNMDKDSLTQLYDDLSAMLGKESELKKSAVLHIHGFESRDIKISMIYNLFSNFGNILRIIFIKTKASALVEFENIEYSTLAREYLNNIIFMGKTLRISFSNYNNISIKNKQISKGNSEEVYLGCSKTFRFKKNKMMSINPPSPILHISNLVKEACVDENLIKQFFSPIGTVQSSKFIFGEKGKNMCLIKLASIEESLKAVAYLHDTEFLGRKIQISFTRSKI